MPHGPHQSGVTANTHGGGMTATETLQTWRTVEHYYQTQKFGGTTIPRPRISEPVTYALSLVMMRTARRLTDRSTLSLSDCIYLIISSRGWGLGSRRTRNSTQAGTILLTSVEVIPQAALQLSNLWH